MQPPATRTLHRIGSGDALSIVMVASEAAPYVKTGGLGDVIAALPRALARLGHDVTVLLPRYRGVTAGTPVDAWDVPMGGRRLSATYVVDHPADRVAVVFVAQPELYDRDEPYHVGGVDHPDNALRFGFLARAALEYAARRLDRVSVVHAHDWQGGLVPLYLRRIYRGHVRLGAVRSVFTIHNVSYQGLMDAAWLPQLDLGPQDFIPAALASVEFYGRIAFLKAGIAFSDLVTTVSPQYAREIQTPEYGCGLDGVIRARSRDLVGILNGIDYDEWDPRRDRFLPVPFDATDLSGKRAAKREVLRRFGVLAAAGDEEAVMRRPLVGMVSRLVDQKGLDLVRAAADRLLGVPASFVIVGSGEARYEQMWRALAAGHPDRIGVYIGFSEELAHLVEGGADIFLMPSRYEPCGLNQMYSLRYGTVPVVRATGGLADTVEEFDQATGRGTGFVFHDYDPEALLAALARAVAAYRDPAVWQRIQLAGMRGDYSWERAAARYVEVYNLLAQPERSTEGEE